MTRWPTAVLSVGVVAPGFLATSSGESLEETSSTNVERVVHGHTERGDALAWALVGFVLVVVLGARAPWARVRSPAAGAWESRMPALERVMPVLLVVAAVVILVMVVLVGDSGARAVWAGKG